MGRIKLILVLLFVSHIIQAQKSIYSFHSDKNELVNGQAAKIHLQESQTNNYFKTNFIYQRLEWEIDPAVKYIKGKITTAFKSLVPQLTEVEFDLVQSLTVDSVCRKNGKLIFDHTQNKLTIHLFHELVFDEIDSLTIYYQGIPNSKGFGSFSQDEHNGVPIIWTLSEPYGAMEWWPCKQSLSDKIDSIDVVVTSPKEFRTASNGKLVSERVVGEKRQMFWKHRYPIATYLVAVATTNYSNYSDTLFLDDKRFIEILNFVYPENLGEIRGKTGITSAIMRLYNGIVGEYPFADEKYGHAQFEWPGGMEHQTMSFMGAFNFDLIAHELAHQWFGDYITLGTWQDIWLNEGFATYLTGLSYENLLEGKWWPVWKSLNKNEILGVPDGSVFVRDTTHINRLFSGRLSYSKGAYLLHMLRWVVGDTDFFAALQNYFNNKKVANGFAVNQDWVQVIETAADTTLTEFFSDWFLGEGYPIYSVEYTQFNADSMVLYLKQSTSHPSVNFFEMPVPIRMYNKNKTDSSDFRLNHIFNEQEFVFHPGFLVGEIKIDPEDWLIAKTAQINSTEIIPDNPQIKVYPNPFQTTFQLKIQNNNEVNSIQLFDVNGQIVRDLNPLNSEFYFPGLNGGVYFLKVKFNQKISVLKMVKQN